MAKVRITAPEQCKWQVSGMRVESEASRVIMEDGGPASAFKIREPGTDTAPQLVELRMHPHEVIEPHYHDEDEIMYVLKGSMEIGSRTVGPGACIYIGGSVVYGFKAGPDGLHFLNFRSHIDNSFHSPTERRFYTETASAE